MAEYIERDAAIKETCFNCSEKAICGGVCDDTDRIRAIPAADVRPVKRGMWIPDYDYAEYDYDGSTPLPEPRKFQDGWQCSLCGGYMPSETNFCTNCGADMREE